MAGNEIADRLLDWYAAAHRVLPWRVPPDASAMPDPYRVWLSEIMLQQTTVAAVIPYFERFTARWPNVAALADADDAEVMSAWAGLGYYARARNIIACARTVTGQFGGAFPQSADELRSLPGVGEYTAAAMAAIAFGRRAVVVDANVERVVARLFAIDTPLPAAKPELRRLAATITPDRRSGDFAQAMMDLGATICRPRVPVCADCPLGRSCKSLALGLAATLPRRAPKAARPVRFASAYWLKSGDRVLTVVRPARGLMGGMKALPLSEITSAPAPCGTFDGAPVSTEWRVNGEVSHVFTHFELRLTVLSAEVSAAQRPDGFWVPVAEIAGAGLPTVFSKAATAAIDGGRREGVAVADA